VGQLRGSRAGQPIEAKEKGTAGMHSRSSTDRDGEFPWQKKKRRRAVGKYCDALLAMKSIERGTGNRLACRARYTFPPGDYALPSAYSVWKPSFSEKNLRKYFKYFFFLFLVCRENPGM